MGPAFCLLVNKWIIFFILLNLEMLGIILIVIAFIVIVFLMKNGCIRLRYQYDNYENIREFSNVYDQQDFYKTHPQVYPISYDYTTGLYALHRDLLEEKAKKELGCRGWDPYKL